jgi:hypothetical protein
MRCAAVARMKRIVVSLVAGFGLVVTSAAQIPHNSASHESAPDIIDGAKTPNLIPDLTAWRLWLIAVTAEDKTKPEIATNRRQTFLRVAGVVDDDMVIADEILARFKTDYASLIENYNNHMSTTPIEEFRAQRDALVQATQTALSGQLAPRSAKSLKTFILGEKAKMKVAKEAQ